MGSERLRLTLRARFISALGTTNFNGRYPAVIKPLAGLPDETVVNGEIVAFDELGRPPFSALQNYGSAKRRSSINFST